MAERPARSKAPYASELLSGMRLVAMTPEMEERLRRVLTVARAIAARGRYPLVLEDVNVLTVRLLEAPGCDPATTIAQRSTLDAGDLLTVTQAARHIGRTPQAIRKAIGCGRLPGVRVGGLWMITRTDLEMYRYRRRSA